MMPQTAGTVSLESAEPEISLPVATAHPHRSFLVRALGLLGRLTEYCKQLGFAPGLRWYCMKVLARVGAPGARRMLIQPPDLAYPVEVRMYPSSDDFVFDQIFVQHEYGALCDRVADAAFIMDLGANVGYASALLASRYPSAHVVCVEPEPGNFQQCKKNLAPYADRIEPLQGAVWARCSRLDLAKGEGCDGKEWATQVTESGDPLRAQVEAWDMPALLQRANRSSVDILKIDIEGSEAEVFGADTDRWLPHVRNICIELHGDRCREVFFNALRGYEYELLNSGEFTICLNLRRSNS